MTAAIYARVSTKDKGQDPENQLRELREYCARRGWPVFAEYVDQATGKNADRDQFSRMFRDASQRRFDVVVTWALDRLTREGILKTFEHLARLKRCGVAFESFSEPQFSGPAADLLLAVGAWVAEQERKRTAERVKAGLSRARGEGKTLGRPRKVFSRQQAAEMRAAGFSWTRIGRSLGQNPETIRSVMRTWGE